MKNKFILSLMIILVRLPAATTLFLVLFSSSILLAQKLGRKELKRAQAYAIKSDNKNAIQAFNKAIEVNPNLAEAYLGRGAVYYNLG